MSTIASKMYPPLEKVLLMVDCVLWVVHGFSFTSSSAR